MSQKSIKVLISFEMIIKQKNIINNNVKENEDAGRGPDKPI